MTITEQHLPGLEPLEVRATQARARRRETRDALSAAAVQDWTETIEGYIEEAHERAATAYQQIRDLLPTHDGQEGCLHCLAVQRHDTAAQSAKRWEDVLAGKATATEYIPRERYVRGEDADGNPHYYLLEDDETHDNSLVSRLPHFDAIDAEALKPETLNRLIQTVSFAPNWCWEPSGVSVVQPVHVRQRIGSDNFVSLKTVKVKEQRSYPGTHYIGTEREGFRLAVHTVWLERRRQWAVYACFDGGRNLKGFTEWWPFEWYLVDLEIHEDKDNLGRDRAEVDRALEIAYLKAKQLRNEWGQVDGTTSIPLPFSPERLSTIADAQHHGMERKRRTHDSGDE